MPRILLLEDDEVLTMGLLYALKEAGYDTDHAETVAEAQRLFAAGRYDCLLLDVLLPDGSGFDFCRTVRASSAVPVLFLTACDEEVNVVQGLDYGGDDYITKPFRVRELLSRIKANVRRSEASAAANGNTGDAAKLVSGAVTLLPLETRALLNGEPVDLTPVEFKLLLLFMRHPLQTLTREQLLGKLFDEQGEFVDDNTLSVYIRRLREKLEDQPSQPERIVTVRGAGYKWNQRSGPHA